MKSLQTKSILFILLLFILFACKKDEDQPNNSIVGIWEWIETTNSWTGIKNTPETEGYTQTSIFKSDNTVKYYKDNELASTKAYQVKEIKHVPQNTDSYSVTVLEIDETEIPFTIQNDTLTLSQAHVDGPTNVYVKTSN